ncbi:hypothetical protein TrVGV298_008901 [Trichoderma virens]|nr:hypothetical protein TrVGV298_008901 [Trichoderma virens]UKZ80863.1 hypothetical protein TrVFT333_008628 [Trichoderma virens FT-333]
MHGMVSHVRLWQFVSGKEALKPTCWDDSYKAAQCEWQQDGRSSRSKLIDNFMENNASASRLALIDVITHVRRILSSVVNGFPGAPLAVSSSEVANWSLNRLSKKDASF